MFTISYNEQLYLTYQDKIRRNEMRSDLFQKELGGVVHEPGMLSVMDDCLPIILLSASTGAGQCPQTALAFLTSSFSHSLPANCFIDGWCHRVNEQIISALNNELKWQNADLISVFCRFYSVRFSDLNRLKKQHVCSHAPSGQLSAVWLAQFIRVGSGTLTSTAILICSHLYGLLWVTKEKRGAQPHTTGAHTTLSIQTVVPGALSTLWGAPVRLTLFILHSLSGCPLSHCNLLIAAVPLGGGGVATLLVELLLRRGLLIPMIDVAAGGGNPSEHPTHQFNLTKLTKCDWHDE